MKKTVFTFAAALSLLAACKKSEDLEAPRLFRPQKAEELSADSNTIVASWLRVAEARSYEVQLSRDTFKTVDATLTLDSNHAVFKKLRFNQLYQVQVKALAPDSLKHSRWSYLGALKTLSSILKVPAIDDITMNSVRVRWTTKGAPVTSVKVIKTADSAVVATADLTAADRASESKILGGLEPGTEYTILMYSDADLRGDVPFRSKAPFSGVVINLTGITGRPNVLADTLPLIPAGSTVLLKRGETYTIATGYSFDKSLVIMSGPDLATTAQAKLLFTSSWSFAGGANVDSVEFNDVYLYGDNVGSRYIFNNTNSANIGKLKFMNSRMEIFRGMVRLQSGTLNLGHLVINNSIVDSIGNYGMINIAASSKIDNITFTNSTFYKIEGVVASSSAANSVLIDNCTFNETPLGNNKNFYFDWGSQNVAAGITVSNCIFGTGKNSNNAFTVKGIRAGSATTIGTINNYRTADYVSGGNDFTNSIISNRTSLQLWQAPASGDFKIMDATFPGRNTTGDPRWRP
ncbi:DUF5123 domain-containing protein [Paraflavisolibacter sp. H34]|uniref:DUF5123 domain-containing protein n=1 Tax=Huijunlia imazamoxiresistens TaxID=3127457 RepID=UPI003017F391